MGFEALFPSAFQKRPERLMIGGLVFLGYRDDGQRTPLTPPAEARGRALCVH